MKIATISGRAHIVGPGGGFDVSNASDGKFPSDTKSLLGELNALQAWINKENPKFDPTLSTAALDASLDRLDAPISDPSQVFAIGLNYAAHGAETGMAIPDQPMIFTKFSSALAGPGATVPLPADTCDWEVEMVVVICKGGRDIDSAKALEHVAGYCVGQDFSERTLQLANTPPQFSFAKSYPNFAPYGPWITTADEIDISAVNISCKNQEETLQAGNTQQMIFDVRSLISYISKVCELRTGDLIFSGTPDGVGMGCNPPRFIEDGWKIESSIEGLGRLSNSCLRSKH